MEADTASAAARGSMAKHGAGAGASPGAATPADRTGRSLGEVLSEGGAGATVSFGAGGAGSPALAGIGVQSFGATRRGIPTWSLFAGVLTGAVATGIERGESVAYAGERFAFDAAQMVPQSCPPVAGPPSQTGAEFAVGSPSKAVALATAEPRT